MKSVVVMEYQNLVDVCIQEYGTIEGLVRLCVDNNLSVGQSLVPGTSLLIDESLNFRKPVTEILASKLLKVRTDFAQAPAIQAGIFDNTFDESFE